MSDPYGPKRDRWGRYLLPDPTTGKERAWTRATTLASTLADTFGLTKWQMRMVAKGLAIRPDLLALAAAAHVDDKQTLDKVSEDAKEAAGSSAGANSGTALHAFTEAVDRGEDPTVPEPWAGDINAYRLTMAAANVQTRPEWIERITVVPEFGVAGTFDRILTMPDGRQVIGDVKTGKDLSYSWGEIAIQLALYAHATHMWHGDRWEPMPIVDPTEAVVIWLPVGRGMCQLFSVNIAAGWEMAAVAHRVRSWRARRDLATTLEVVTTTVAPLPDLTDRRIRREIEQAATVDELVAVWAAHEPSWTPELTALAAARKRALAPAKASSPAQ